MTRLEELSSRYFIHCVIACTVLAALLRMYGLSDMPPLFDEISTARDAFDYMDHGHLGRVMWQHPKLRSILVYEGLTAFGLNVWGLRFFSLMFSVMSIPLISLVSRKITGSSLAALLSAFLLCVDTVHIDFSRQAIQEVYMPFFVLSGILLVLTYRSTHKTLLLPLAGLFFGLGMAGKWYALFPLPVLVLVLLLDVLQVHGVSFRVRLNESIFIVLSLCILPFAIYLLTYFPWFYHRGYGLDEWFATQRIMYDENLVHQGFNRKIVEMQDHNQLLWFIRPVAFVDFMLAEGRPVVLIGMTNPFIWIPTIPAFCYLIYQAVFNKDWNKLLLPALLLITYLPFAVAQRQVSVNSSLSVAPAVFMLVSQAVAILTEKTRRWNIAVAGWLILVILCAIPLYLLATGKGHDTILHHIIDFYRPINE